VCQRQRGLDAPIGLVHAHELLAAARGDATVKLADLSLARAPESLVMTLAALANARRTP
jgi:hypothetical protein